MFESGLWEMIRKPRGGCSRPRDQVPGMHDFAWWRCRQKELEGNLAQLSGGSMSTVIID